MFRREIEAELLPWCRANGVGVLVYGPLAHGLLSGKFDRSSIADDWRSGHEMFGGDQAEHNLEAVERLSRFAQERGYTVAQLAVAWTLAQPGVHVAITGARRPEHIEGVAAGAEIELSDEELTEIDELTAPAVQVAGPTPEG